MPKLKPLNQQVIVITGATSGIGLATTREAAKAGAKLVLVARNEDALAQLSQELTAMGAEVETVAGDIADITTAERAAAQAVERFGRVDSWCNIAGAFIYGTVQDTPIADQRRLFDVSYWGLVQSCMVAARHLKPHGGAIINVGSVLGDRTMALQGPYSAAKFAVKAITDAMRMEFAMAGDPISVTLIKPAAMDTPYMEHARNLLGSPGTRNPPPAYHPRLVAQAILYACAHPKRDITVGGAGLAVSVFGNLFPRLSDIGMQMIARPTQTTDDPGRAERRDNLYEAREDMAETSSLGGLPPRRTSMVLEAQINPMATTAFAVAGTALALFLRAALQPAAPRRPMPQRRPALSGPSRRVR